MTWTSFLYRNTAAVGNSAGWAIVTIAGQKPNILCSSHPRWMGRESVDCEHEGGRAPSAAPAAARAISRRGFSANSWFEEGSILGKI